MKKGSRKRQRTNAADAADAANGLQVDSDSDDKPIVRDKEYYREDGDCTILVDRVLFKVHRFLLERDASAFSNMFSMPQGNARCQGNTDEDPLVLFDDVEDFRALCWIIYALPATCLQQYHLDTANIQKLVSLYLIAHKYHFESHQKFARELLQIHCASIEETRSDQVFYFGPFPQSRLQSFLRIASLEDDASTEDSLCDILQNLWIDRLHNNRESTSFAFEVGEALGLRVFLARLYYIHLERMKPERIEGSNAYIHADDDLNPRQQLVLYHGCWSLRYYWLEVREAALSKGFSCSSSRQHACRRIWKRSWETVKDHMVDSTTFDPLYELTVVRVGISKANEEEFAYVPCATEAIREIRNEVIHSLADHFLGPL